MPTFYFEHDEYYGPEELFNIMHEEEIKEMFELCKNHLYHKHEQPISPMEEEFVEICDNISKNYIKLSNEEIEMVKKISEKIL